MEAAQLDELEYCDIVGSVLATVSLDRIHGDVWGICRHHSSWNKSSCADVATLPLDNQGEGRHHMPQSNSADGSKW